MKYLYSSIYLLFVLLCSCNKEGDITVVVEDGQPTIEVMILGKWQPTVKSWVNLETGEIYSQEPISGDDLLEFFEDGTCGFSGDKMNWRADNEDFSVYLDGEYWNIASLTERLMRLYREGKSSDKGYVPNGWLVYDFDRIGNFEHEEEEGEPDATVSHRIVRLKVSHTNTTTLGADYRFKYDSQGRIQEVIQANETAATYIYQDNYVEIKIGNSNTRHRFFLNSAGYTEKIERSIDKNPWETMGICSYNKDGQIISLYDKSFSYTNGDRYWDSGYNEVEYTDIENNTFPDVNGFIGTNIFTYLIEPFGFFGKPSKHLLACENISTSDFYSIYEYAFDDLNRVNRIIQTNHSKFNNEVFGQILYDITYAE